MKLLSIERIPALSEVTLEYCASSATSLFWTRTQRMEPVGSLFRCWLVRLLALIAALYLLSVIQDTTALTRSLHIYD